jgi:hypothetical protein
MIQGGKAEGRVDGFFPSERIEDYAVFTASSE